MNWLGNGVAAHRGNSSQFPENTLESFESAISLGCSWIELDIQKTLDNKLVVTHDTNSLRVSGTDLVVEQNTYDTLCSLNFGAYFDSSKTYKLPLLADVFDLIRNTNTRVSIQPKLNGLVRPAIALAKSANAIDKIAFNEVNCEYLIEAKRLESTIPVIWDRLPNSDLENDIYIAKQFNFNALMFVEEALTIEKAARAQSENIVCGACVVNSESQMDKYLSWGIDFYYTDFPEKLLLKK